MKKILILLLLLSAPAVAADDGAIHLPGNTTVLPNNGSNVIIQGYDRDDLIYRRIVNPYAVPRRSIRTYPANDGYAICAGIDRERKRERCIEEVNEDREKLLRKYN